jgi:GAF domain-containing protein
VSIPLLQHGESIGVLGLRRQEVRPFSAREIALLETFADQAVIAIENARLFEELEQRNRDLAEALEQQTATANILRVIASSPGDVQPVLNAVATSAMLLSRSAWTEIITCEGDITRIAARAGEGASRAMGMLVDLSLQLPGNVAIREARTVHIPDRSTDAFRADYPDSTITGRRASLFVPLLRDGRAIGNVSANRDVAESYSDRDIALLETFAAQAVIAIENARLFSELGQRTADLSEALEQQTALAEVLRVIAASPTNLDAALHAVAESAQRLCGAAAAVINQVVGDRFRIVALAGFAVEIAGTSEERPLIPTAPVSRAMLTKTMVITDDAQDAAFRADYPDIQGGTNRSTIWLPLMRDDTVIGSLSVARDEVRPFNEREIALVTAFADQAVIAIENARLFQELQDSNRQVSEALEQQTATAEVLRVIASSPANLRASLDAILVSAARLGDADIGWLFKEEGGLLYRAAIYPSVDASGYSSVSGLEPRRDSVPMRAFVDRRTFNVDDVAALPEEEFALAHESHRRVGHRSNIGVPLLRGDVAVGVISLARREVRPFGPAEIALLEMFADQAVIAIQNAGLFQELEQRTADLSEALTQQTALGEVLRVIASSPTDLDRVLQEIMDTAASLCDAPGALLVQYREQDGRLVPRARSGRAQEQARRDQRDIRPARGVIPTRASGAGRAYLEGRTIQVADMAEAVHSEYPGSRETQARSGFRSVVYVPLLRHGARIGVLSMHRFEVRPFTAQQVALLEAFADQAVIAIENARLFEALQEANAQLAEASQH